MMRFIDDKSLDRLGYRSLLNRVETLSPYGKEKLNKLFFYVQGQENLLAEEYRRMEKLRLFFKDNDDVLYDIESNIHSLKNIKNILKNINNVILDEVDICEIKVQIMSFIKIRNIIINYADIFEKLILSDLTKLFEELDPRNEKTPTFYIYDEYSDKLREIRKLKKEIENKIFITKGYEEIKKLKEDRLNLVVEEEKEEAVIKRKLSSSIIKYADDILENINKVGEIDLIIAKIKFAEKYGGVKPEVNLENKIYMKEMVNIELKEILEKQGKKYTGIDIELKKGATVITGANMGGKSVALKTITENILLFHMGFYVFGKEASIPLFNYIFFISDDMQDLSKGLSTFGSEIIKLKEINVFLKQADGFIVFDEFARGTNPKEGQRFVKALINYLNTKSSISLLTTHFDSVISDDVAHYQVIGLKNLDLNKIKNKLILNKNSIEVIQDNMDFRLEKSESKKVPEDALNIARLIGIDKELSDMIIKEYDKEELLNG